MGRGVDAQSLAKLVGQEAQRVVAAPAGPERRKGGAADADEVIADCKQSIEDTDRMLGEGKIDSKQAASYLAEHSLQMASTLFVAGAEPQAWRRWMGLSSLGHLLLEKRGLAAQLAILAGEWELVARIDRTPPLNRRDVGSVVLWSLIGGATSGELHYEDDPFDTAWRALAASIPARDHAATEAALKTIADFWIADSDGDWESYHPGDYPDFEQVSNAVAAWARHQGYTPRALSTGQYRFLEAGLQPGDATPLVPATVSW